MKQYVIIGGGVAAVGCIEGIRSQDQEGKIIMIAGEGCPVYCRPLISYYLQGKTDLERMKYRDDSFYEKNNCEVIYGTAKKIDVKNKSVLLESGESVFYDALCVAAGSSPFVPPMKYLEAVENAFCFMTEKDALSLEKAITPESRVLIIGAGLIGLKCAEGLCGRVKKITVCDLADRVLSSILDETCAARMQKKMEEQGVEFLLNDSVDYFEKKSAMLKSKQEIPFDVLVTAVGVRPNVSLVQEIGGDVDRGIRIGTDMKTSLPDIYAAGDCTQGYDASTGTNRILAILPNAYMQGRTAGTNMAGGEEVFDDAIPMNAIGFFGLHALTAGSYEGEMYEEKTEDSLKRLFVKDGLLKGFMMIGDTDRAGIYTALIRNKTPLEEVDFALLEKSPSLLAFSATNRKKMLGGVV